MLREGPYVNGCLRRVAFARMAWLVLVLLSLPLVACAQFRYNQWTVDGGLPQNVVRGIRQSADGYLWLATLDGLARFDGVKFTVYNKSNTPGIVSNRFSSMVQMTDGDLWLAVESGGVTRLHAGRFETYGAEHGIPRGVVSGLNADHSNHLWVLAEGRILEWNPTSARFVDATPTVNVRYESSVWTNGGFWGLENGVLYVFHDGSLTHYDLSPTVRRSRIWGAAVDPDRSIVYELIDGKQGRVYPTGVIPPKQESQVQTTKWTDRNGHFWVMPIGRHLRRNLQDISGLPGGKVPFSCYFEDRQGNFWVGTEGQGLYRFKRQVIKTYLAAEGAGLNRVYPLLQDHKGDIWAGIWNTGIAHVHDGTFTTYRFASAQSEQASTALFEDRGHRLWVGSYSGLRVMEHGRFHDSKDLLLPPGAVVQAMTQGADGTLWLGTDKGLVEFKDGRTIVYTQHDGLAADDVHVLIWDTNSRDGRDHLWIGGYGGLSLMRGNSFSHWTEKDGLPSSTIRSLYQDGEGTLWIGTYDGGLGRMKDGHITRFRMQDGLFQNGVFAIVEDRHENLWMSSNRGIYSVSKRQLNDFAAGIQDTISSVGYGKGDGMLNVECNGGVWPSAIKATDGKLWFPTQEGIAIVDPEAVVADDRTPPPVLIESALLDRQPVLLDGLLRLPPGKDDLEIHYTSPSFIKSNQLHFKYRLLGMGSEWTDVGARRTAYYSHLAPGSYQFQVIAGTAEGAWNLTGAHLNIEAMPPWYRTWWFTLLAVAAVMLFVASAWRYRVAQFEAIQTIQQTFSHRLITTQETERKRIAVELHDGLGQRLVVINQLALLADREMKRKSNAPNPLNEISVEASLAIQEIRQISHDLRPVLLDRIGLRKAIQSILRTVATASGIHIRVDVDDIDDYFPEELRINLFRIVQEALNNIMKHSGATEVDVQIRRSGERLTLRIEDNGCGFEGGQAGETTGLGVQGMAERASLLGGNFELNSIAGKTVLTVEIRKAPAPIEMEREA